MRAMLEVVKSRQKGGGLGQVEAPEFSSSAIMGRYVMDLGLIRPAGLPQPECKLSVLNGGGVKVHC